MLIILDRMIMHVHLLCTSSRHAMLTFKHYNAHIITILWLKLCLIMNSRPTPTRSKLNGSLHLLGVIQSVCSESQVCTICFQTANETF